MVTLGVCYERHLRKYAGSDDTSYVIFALSVARKIIVSRYDNMLKNALKIEDISELAMAATMIDEGVTDETALQQYLIEYSESPVELAKMWLGLKADSESYVDVNSVLSNWLSAFPRKNFERWGDRNCLSDVSRSWFKADGVALDIQVQEINSMSEIGREVTIEDCIEFVKNYNVNGYKNPVEIMRERIKEKFMTITGFGLKEYYAQHLIDSFSVLSDYKNVEETENVPF